MFEININRYVVVNLALEKGAYIKHWEPGNIIYVEPQKKRCWICSTENGSNLGLNQKQLIETGRVIKMIYTFEVAIVVFAPLTQMVHVRALSELHAP